MALTIGDNFSYQGAKPLDARLQYATIAEMKATADSTLYDGIIAYCKADGKNYQWKSTNPIDDILGKWKEFQSGGGGASELANLDDVDLDTVADGDVLKYDATEEKWVNGEIIEGAGRAKSSAIAPVFDATATYAAGDRVMYEDALYVFNTAHTGAWAAADADKSDVDSEIPDKLTSQQMQEIKDTFIVDSPRNGYPVLFDETGAEHFVGWYKYSDGTKQPIYEKTFSITFPSSVDTWKIVAHNISNIKAVIKYDGYLNNSVGQYWDLNAWANSARFWCTTVTPTEIQIFTNFDRIVGRPGIIKIYYTKTTDTPQ